MALLDGLFSSPGGYRIAQRSTLPAWQEEALRNLLSRLNGIGSTPSFNAARGAYTDAINASPVDTENWFNQTVQAPALESFQKTVLPGIARRSQGSFFSSDRLRADSSAQADLLDSLTQARAGTAFQAAESQRNRALQAAGGLQSLELTPVQLIASLLQTPTHENIATPTNGSQGLFSNAGELASTAALAFMLFSDERLKEDVTDAGDEIDEMLGALRSVGFRYKNPARHGKGRRVGVMAQDLERSEAGRRMVVDTPEGKMVDVAQVALAALSAAAHINAKLDDLTEAA